MIDMDKLVCYGTRPQAAHSRLEFRNLSKSDQSSHFELDVSGVIAGRSVAANLPDKGLLSWLLLRI